MIRFQSVSKGVKKELHGIVINEIWKAWDTVSKKYESTERVMSIVELKVDKANNGLLHINFIDEHRKFKIKTLTGTDNTVVIIGLQGGEAMLLESEAKELCERLVSDG